MGYPVRVRCADGAVGWPDAAPFDVIIAAAAPLDIPPALVDQLAPGGRLVLPIGCAEQRLLVIERREDGAITRRDAGGVRFVPMTGAALS